MASALTGWLERGIAEHALDADEIATAQVALERADAFAGERPTPCHGDFRPRNWILGPGGVWRGTVDFEHMRWDLPLTDIGIWWDRIPFIRPDLREAFMAGYGACLDGPRKTQMQVIRVLAALARIVAGRASGRRGIEAGGCMVLRRLAQDLR
jgi:thiamine kinase-like enzyme